MARFDERHFAGERIGIISILLLPDIRFGVSYRTCACRHVRHNQCRTYLPLFGLLLFVSEALKEDMYYNRVLYIHLKLMVSFERYCM